MTAIELHSVLVESDLVDSSMPQQSTRIYSSGLGNTRDLIRTFEIRLASKKARDPHHAGIAPIGKFLDKIKEVDSEHVNIHLVQVGDDRTFGIYTDAADLVVLGVLVADMLLLIIL